MADSLSLPKIPLDRTLLSPLFNFCGCKPVLACRMKRVSLPLINTVINSRNVDRRKHTKLRDLIDPIDFYLGRAAPSNKPYNPRWREYGGVWLDSPKSKFPIVLLELDRPTRRGSLVISPLMPPLC